MLNRIVSRLSERLRLLPFAINGAALLARDAPGGLQMPGQRSANRNCLMCETQDNWLAVNLARTDDIEVLAAMLGQADDLEACLLEWMVSRPSEHALRELVELHLPVSALGEGSPLSLVQLPVSSRSWKVIDMSALWAGPLCGALLAKAGCTVERIDSRGRPDPTALSSPTLHQFLNGQKETFTLDLREPVDRSLLMDRIAGTDMLITSGRRAALGRMGLTSDFLFALNPGLRWVAITAHGFMRDQASRVGFGDDCAVAGGLVDWSAGRPVFIGDALADPLTGVEAALSALASDRTGLIDMPMAGVAASYREMAMS